MKLSEEELDFLETQIPDLAEAAFKQAYWAALSSGCSVLVSEGGYLVEVIVTTATAVISAAKVFTVLIAASAAIVPAVIGLYFGAVFHKGLIGKFQFAIGNFTKFHLYGIVMHQFFMPVAVSKLHVISNYIGKALPFFGVGFYKRFIQNGFYIFSQVVILGIPFWVMQRLGFCL